MFRKVLFPTDFSQGAYKAIKEKNFKRGGVKYGNSI